MRNRLYLKVAAVIMAITALPVFSLTAQAQRQVHVTELQKQPDGTEVYVPKTIEVPEKSAEEVAAAKRKAATVTAEEDDLQYFLNNLAMTRAGESPVVIDLSTFSATTRETTLEVSNGLSLKFTNGTIKRGTGLPSNEPIIKISNGTVVEFDETVTISGENLSTNGRAVDVMDASLKTAAWIGNLKKGTEESYHNFAIYGGSSSSILEILGGTLENNTFLSSNLTYVSLENCLKLETIPLFCFKFCLSLETCILPTLKTLQHAHRVMALFFIVVQKLFQLVFKKTLT